MLRAGYDDNMDLEDGDGMEKILVGMGMKL